MDTTTGFVSLGPAVQPEPTGESWSPRVLTGPGADQAPRWRPGERLQHLFEACCDRQPDAPAVDTGGQGLSFAELDARVNRLARHLLAAGAAGGDRIALLCDDPVNGYVGMLAVLKINAAYVPLDVAFPGDRLAYILADAGVRLVLSRAALRPLLASLPVSVLCLDEAEGAIAARDCGRLTVAETGQPVDELCYVIYTSGSTGRPKGVAVEHASICNFVRVAAEVYGLEPGDRVYQGMTLAFDFSVEEIWVPWQAGCTLVPKPRGQALVGEDLRTFLRDRRVTALCCVPTLLATIDEDLPELRFLLVSGEACPPALIARWHRAGRRLLNVYGPTEATVTATWTVARPDGPATIGTPLPTYRVLILDPDEDRALAAGEIGEIGIAGIGLARGYVNRDDLTHRAFVPDFLGLPHNPSGRIYRTGDLGRITEQDEIEYLGRVDTQVKIRGYRVELTEIESVLLELPGVAQAVVRVFEPSPGVVELAAYCSLVNDAARLDRALVHAKLRERLPAYMIPSYLEELPAIPMLPSGKADRKALPPPTGPRNLVTLEEIVRPSTGLERALAELLAQVMGADRVSVASHFFDEIGANSLLMAQFCARVRQWRDLPPISMRSVYQHPTVRSLATALAEAGVSPAPVHPAAPARATPPVGRAQYLLCGLLQACLFFAWTYLTALFFLSGLEWTFAAQTFAGVYLRSAAFGLAGLGLLCACPILAKWLLIGRWTAQEIPLWSWRYVRFWLVRLLIQKSPMLMFVGTPLYNFYLRALGARIGRGAVILSSHVPACTDLLSVGHGTLIRSDCFFNGYRARDGRIETGPIALGDGVLVGDATVLEIHTAMGDRAQLGHGSALYRGQAIPAGERWHGCPAEPTRNDFAQVPPARCGAWRRGLYAAGQLLALLLLYLPLSMSGLAMLATILPGLAEHLHPEQPYEVSKARFYLDWLAFSILLFFGGLLGGLLAVGIVPRVLNLLIEPRRVYPLFGLHFSVQQLIRTLTNSKFYVDLFGDSSYILHYLKFLGYRISTRGQTGSNFGTTLAHDTPFQSGVGEGTMVSDGLVIINAEFSSSSFRVMPVELGERCYLGNRITFPPGARVGDNCLLATKVMVPTDGPLRAGVGLLGSPCFEIPRSVRRDSAFDRLKRGSDFRLRLAAKNRHNLVTMAVFLGVRCLHFLAVNLIALAAVDLYHQHGGVAAAMFPLLVLLFSVAYFVLAERTVMGFRRLSPQFCSLYDRYFWWHERYWKLLTPAFILDVFNGTPFKPFLWRLLGARVGARLFDDGCSIPERTLVSIGDDCTLNAGTTLQCHSLEDAAFKSERIVLGSGATMGVGAFVHYGTTFGEGAALDAHAFLMKGETIPPGASWGGNPARELTPAAPPEASLICVSVDTAAPEFARA